MHRRRFLQTSTLALGAAGLPSCLPETPPGVRSDPVTGEIGVTTGSFMDHIAFEPTEGKIRMLDLPAIMRDELGLRVIDFMSRTLESFEPRYLERLRKAVEDHGCIVTNLKCNQNRRGQVICGYQSASDSLLRRFADDGDVISPSRSNERCAIAPVAGAGLSPGLQTASRAQLGAADRARSAEGCVPTWQSGYRAGQTAITAGPMSITRLRRSRITQSSPQSAPPILRAPSFRRRPKRSRFRRKTPSK